MSPKTIGKNNLFEKTVKYFTSEGTFSYAESH